MIAKTHLEGTAFTHFWFYEYLQVFNVPNENKRGFCRKAHPHPASFWCDKKGCYYFEIQLWYRKLLSLMAFLLYACTTYVYWVHAFQMVCS